MSMIVLIIYEYYYCQSRLGENIKNCLEHFAILHVPHSQKQRPVVFLCSLLPQIMFIF